VGCLLVGQRRDDRARGREAWPEVTPSVYAQPQRRPTPAVGQRPAKRRINVGLTDLFYLRIYTGRLGPFGTSVLSIGVESGTR